MKLLLDKQASFIEQRRDKISVGGQLLTPLTRYRLIDDMQFAIDNGAFSKFEAGSFLRTLDANKEHKQRCLFVASPDVVGNARRTIECFHAWYYKLCDWPIALVIQDGIDDLPIEWDLIDAVFIGGSTDFKMSKSAADVIKAAKIIGKHVHVGRVNTVDRWRHFEQLNVDTCDGSGVSRYDWMLDAIETWVVSGEYMPLLSGVDAT